LDCSSALDVDAKILEEALTLQRLWMLMLMLSVTPTPATNAKIWSSIEARPAILASPTKHCNKESGSSSKLHNIIAATHADFTDEELSALEPRIDRGSVGGRRRQRGGCLSLWARHKKDKLECGCKKKHGCDRKKKKHCAAEVRQALIPRMDRTALLVLVLMLAPPPKSLARPAEGARRYAPHIAARIHTSNEHQDASMVFDGGLSEEVVYASLSDS